MSNLVSSRSRKSTKNMLLVSLLASSMFAFAGEPQLKQEAQKPAPSTAPFKPSNAPASTTNWHAFEGGYYKRKWGVEIISIRLVSSGSMLRFTYQILDAEKAKTLNEKRWNPFLIDQATGSKLGVPEMEKVGKLRQSSPPENGRNYWMVFGNPGGLVKRGNRVSVVIGGFRADGLVVE
jgi:hypothetical protein